jgi:GNAT superfamily N-acetyltransferase
MSSDGLVFRDFRPEDKDAILDLLALGRVGERAAQYPMAKRAVFDWQFFDNPQAAGRSPFIVGTVNGGIVAVNGLMPVGVRVAGQCMQACWSLDIYVSGDYRGRGFGRTLVEKVSASAPVLLCFGISDMSDPIFEKFNWVLDPSMATMFYHVNEPGVKGLVKGLMSRGVRTLRIQPQRPTDLFSLEPQVAAAELDDLWTSVMAQFPNVVERDGAYLVWRYQQSPALRYNWVTARQNGTLRAVMVIRHHPVESVLVDYAGPLDDPSLLTSLVEFASAQLASDRTQRIRCETNNPAMLHALELQGYRRYRHASRFRVRSNLPDSMNLSSWFIMTGDSDNDLLAL